MASGGRWVLSSCVLLVILRVIRTELLHSDSLGRGHKTPSHEFARHAVVRPRLFHGRTKRELSSTLENVEGGHVHDLTVGFDLDGRGVVLDLRLNRALIPARYFRRYQHNGRHVVNRPTGDEVRLCQYQGELRERNNSWAAISTCNGLRGVIFDGEEMHYLEPGSDDEHFVYKHSDITTNQTCGYSGTPHHILENNEFNRILRYKRSSEIIRGPYNANRRSRYVELVLVVDHKEYKELGESMPNVHNHCKEIANIINALYMPLNIFVALVGVVVWNETDEISLSTNGDTTLTNFLLYRRERLVKEHPNDNAQLLTRVQFENGVVGKALKGPICTYEFSGGVSMDHSSTVGLVATTVAHEMGHNLGMEHDTAECACSSERCIMASSSSNQSPTQWSSCSLEYLAVAFDHGMDYCLRNKPTSLFDSPVCGNGFVEPGEQCDCGLKDRCDNPCCNASTCMLLSNASCATGECCDLKTCRPKSAGSECREALHECDLPEFCTGQGEYCPEDVYKMDSETCERGKAFCYQGTCRTHTDQCRLLWGPSGKSSDKLCYQMNTNGTRHGNCGFNKLNRSYIKCHDENIYCGMLHCRHLNERLEFGMESVSILSHSFINNAGAIIPCRTAIVDLGLNEVDPGLTPDGAKCGDGMMCVNQKCMAVGSLRKQTGLCPMDCSGNGVCNSKGHCHCNVGFSPPHCDYPGTGGSQDSGPATDPDTQRDIMTALYIIFLGIVPFCAVVAMFAYYMRRRGAPFWKKSALSDASSPTKSGRKSPRVSRGNSLAFRATSPGGGAVEISAPLDARHGSDNAHASLLSAPTAPSAPSTPAAAAALSDNLFGHFKGFSITPIADPAPPPTKAAPPPPRITHTASQNAARILAKLPNLGKNGAANGKPLPITKNNSMSRASANAGSPALPPANAGSCARPLIGQPVLDATTCSAKELGAARLPTRPAPEVPAPAAPAAAGFKVELVPLAACEDDDARKEAGAYPTLTRIASFMMRQNAENRKAKAKLEKSNSLPKSQVHGVKASKLQIDRESLRKIEISNPIPQQDTEPSLALADLDAAKVVMRAQSLRDATAKKPDLPGFGSMRGKRPTSIPPSTRPTSPPPRPPPPPTAPRDPGIVGLPGYQNPPEYCYDDCVDLVQDGVAPLANIDEESPTSADNIYAVIEESPPENGRKNYAKAVATKANALGRFDYAAPGGEYKTPKPIENSTSAGSVESVGLLSEIVSEIQARNTESIYSASGNEESDPSAAAYANAADAYRPYSNVSSHKSSASSTSSSNGYLSPTKLKAHAAPTEPAPVRPAPGVPAKTGAMATAFGAQITPLTSQRPTPNVQQTPPSGQPVRTFPLASTAPPARTFPSIGAPAKTFPAASAPNPPTGSSTLAPKAPVGLLASLGPKPGDLGAAPVEGYKPYSSSLHRPGPFAASFRKDEPTSSDPPKPLGFKPVSSDPPKPLGFKPVSSDPPKPLGFKPVSSDPPKPLGFKPVSSDPPKPLGFKPVSSDPPKQLGFKPVSSDPPKPLGFKPVSSDPPKPLGFKPVSSDPPKPLVLSVNEVSKILRSKELADKAATSPPAARRDVPAQNPSSLTSKPSLNRTVTPPSLTPGGKTSPPSRSIASNLPKKLPSLRSPPSNSPDLVSSCNASSANKSPDVLLGKAEGRKQAKPVVPVSKIGVAAPKQPPVVSRQPGKVDGDRPRAGSAAISGVASDKAKFGAAKESAAGRIAPVKLSHVASLQQKFETAASDKDKSAKSRTSASANAKRPAVAASSSSFKK